MIEADRPFSAIAQQLLAARGSLDSLLMRLVELNVRDGVADADACEAVIRVLETAFLRSGQARRRKDRRDAG